jgi:hypothetical protein
MLKWGVWGMREREREESPALRVSMGLADDVCLLLKGVDVDSLVLYSFHESPQVSIARILEYYRGSYVLI